MTRATERAVPPDDGTHQLNELFDSAVVGRLRSNYTRGVAWQAGRPIPA